PGLVTRTGLHTFVDPRRGGGRANAAATEELVALLELDGREYLHYRPMPVDVALIRGTEADPLGNIGCAEEPAVLDVLALAQAAGGVLNVGFGLAAEVVDALAERGRLHEVTLAIEQGLFNGVPETGTLFGVAHGPTVRLPSTNQFELFAMGLLDTCCLGM